MVYEVMGVGKINQDVNIPVEEEQAQNQTQVYSRV